MFENLLSFKKSVASLAADVQKVRDAIEKLQQQREEVATAPATREDVKAMVEQWITGKAALYLKKLRFNMDEFIANPRQALADPVQIENRMSLFGKSRQLGEYAMYPGPELQDEAMSLLFGPHLVKAMHVAIDAMEWPPNALPLAGRAERLAELDEKISKLSAEEAEVVAEARNAGVTFNLPATSLIEAGKRSRS
jgi:hypothetical protein